MTQKDWAYVAAVNAICDQETMHDPEPIASALREAEQRGRVAGLREAADRLLPSDGSGLLPYSAMRFVYDDFRNLADELEKQA